MKRLWNAVAMLVFSVPLLAGTRTWLRVIDWNWSTPVNWDGGLPLTGDDVVMRDVGWSFNDLPSGLELHSLIVVEGTHVRGNDIVLGAGGLSTTGPPAPGQSTLVEFSRLTLSASQTWTNPARNPFVSVGPTSLNGNTLTMDSTTSGSIQTLSGPGKLVNAGSTTLVASHDSRNEVVAKSGRLAVAVGALGLAHVEGGLLDLWGPSVTAIVVNTGTLLLREQSSAGSLSFAETPGEAKRLQVLLSEAFVNGANRKFYGGITVSGTVTLGNAILDVIPDVRGPEPVAIINNTGVAPVTGTFLGLPEGAIVNYPQFYSFRLSYIGGDGNDVTLTRSLKFYPDSTTTLTSSGNPSHPGRVTLTAKVAPRCCGGSAPQGSVSFYDGSVLLGTSSLDAAGRATLTVDLSRGTHTIAAGYAGSAIFASSNGTLQQQVIVERTRAARH